MRVFMSACVCVVWPLNRVLDTFNCCTLQMAKLWAFNVWFYRGYWNKRSGFTHYKYEEAISMGLKEKQGTLCCVRGVEREASEKWSDNRLFCRKKRINFGVHLNKQRNFKKTSFTDGRQENPQENIKYVTPWHFLSYHLRILTNLMFVNYYFWGWKQMKKHPLFRLPTAQLVFTRRKSWDLRLR